jgi:hypothetical protein
VPATPQSSKQHGFQRRNDAASLPHSGYRQPHPKAARTAGTRIVCKRSKNYNLAENIVEIKFCGVHCLSVRTLFDISLTFFNAFLTLF